MKNFLFILLIIIASFILFDEVFGDWYIPINSLPKNAQLFIKQIYPQAQIWSVEKDGLKYEVKLSNGASIDFNGKGDWINIDGEYTGIPEHVLPSTILNSLKNQYPDAIIIDIEKEWGNYKIKLNNMMEIYISNTGQLIGQKWDD